MCQNCAWGFSLDTGHHVATSPIDPGSCSCTGGDVSCIPDFALGGDPGSQCCLSCYHETQACHDYWETPE
jgi:hypothetical protein